MQYSLQHCYSPGSAAQTVHVKTFLLCEDQLLEWFSMHNIIYGTGKILDLTETFVVMAYLCVTDLFMLVADIINCLINQYIILTSLLIHIMDFECKMQIMNMERG